MSTTPIHVWRMPVALAGLSAFGLIAALLGDGVGEVAGWLALSIPVAVVGWFSTPSIQRRASTKTDNQDEGQHDDNPR